MLQHYLNTFRIIHVTGVAVCLQIIIAALIKEISVL